MGSDNEEEDRESSHSGVGSATLTDVSHTPTSFLSSVDIGSLRKRLQTSRADIKKIMLSSKDAKEKRKAVEDAQHYETFNSITTAYIQMSASMHTMSSIRDMMHEEISRACSSFLKSTGAKECSAKFMEVDRTSYANIAGKDTTDKVRVPRGSCVKIQKTTNIVIGPTENAVEKYTSSQDTKDAVLKTIDSCKVGLKVSRLTKIRNNSIRIEAQEVNLGKLKISPGLREAGLEVKDEVKLNPRIIIHNISAELTEDEIKSQLAKQNKEGTEKDIKVIYRYPLHPGKQYSSCVLEVRPEMRQRFVYMEFVSMERVFLGWSVEWRIM